MSNLNSKEGGKGKSFADAGLHIFKTQALLPKGIPLGNKCANAGGLGLVVNESYSTVTCHVCKGETGLRARQDYE